MTNNKIAVPRNITDEVYNRAIDMRDNGNLQFPRNYSVGNALKSAWLVLQDTKDRNKQPVLKVCTKESIANALLDMVVQGLNPVKNQCYFVAYGNQLTTLRSYLGTIAVTKRLDGVKDVKGYAIYESDELKLGFDFITGKQTVEKYNPGLNRDPKNLKGAMALIIGEKEILHVEYMSIDQIKQSWSMGATDGKSKAHNKFPDQMAIKSVINRACKMYANTSDDSDKVSYLLNNSMDQTDEEMYLEMSENANSKELPGIDYQEENEEVPENIDVETGEIIENKKEEKTEQNSFFPDDFKPVTDDNKAPF